MKALPQFQPQPREAVLAFVHAVFTHPGQTAASSAVHRLVAYPDGHYRVIFRRSYFILPPGQPEPSKSQWNTLKKKMKRRHPRVFIFKEHGEIACGPADHATSDAAPDSICCYLDFGFLAR